MLFCTLRTKSYQRYSFRVRRETYLTASTYRKLERLMKKIKYHYNPQTLRYEKHETPLRVKLLRVFGFIAAAIFTAIIIVTIAFKYIDSPKEKLLRQQLNTYKEYYVNMADKLTDVESKMKELERRDNEIYRSIFEANPIPDSARLEEIEKNVSIQVANKLTEDDLLGSVNRQLNELSSRVSVQANSYVDIVKMIKNKEKLLAAIPAIQPVSNKNLNRIASGFGYRIDPVYKVTKFHPGLDFTAPQGTPIYATADGTVATAEYNNGGYGRNVVINHGYGYQTLYGHMVRIKVTRGQSVKRGEVIGWVGSTGKSTGPHCHYEVHKNGQRIDPIYYFYNDLSPAQFERLLKLAATSNQSFD